MRASRRAKSPQDSSKLLFAVAARAKLLEVPMKNTIEMISENQIDVPIHLLFIEGGVIQKRWGDACLS